MRSKLWAACTQTKYGNAKEHIQAKQKRRLIYNATANTTLAVSRVVCSYLSLWLLGTMSVKSSRVSSQVTSYVDIDTDVSRVLKADRQTGRVERLGSQWLISPGPRPRETPGGSDGWRTATAPRRCWTWVCVGCPLDGGSWQAPRTLMETLEKEAALLEEKKRKAGLEITNA